MCNIHDVVNEEDEEYEPLFPTPVIPLPDRLPKDDSEYVQMLECGKHILRRIDNSPQGREVWTKITQRHNEKMPELAQRRRIVLDFIKVFRTSTDFMPVWKEFVEMFFLEHRAWTTYSNVHAHRDHLGVVCNRVGELQSELSFAKTALVELKAALPGMIQEAVRELDDRREAKRVRCVPPVRET